MNVVERKKEILPRGSHKVGSVTHHPWGKRGGNLQIEFRKSEYLILYQNVGNQMSNSGLPLINIIV